MVCFVYIPVCISPLEFKKIFNIDCTPQNLLSLYFFLTGMNIIQKIAAEFSKL